MYLVLCLILSFPAAVAPFLSCRELFWFPLMHLILPVSPFIHVFVLTLVHSVQYTYCTTYVCMYMCNSLVLFAILIKTLHLQLFHTQVNKKKTYTVHHIYFFQTFITQKFLLLPFIHMHIHVHCICTHFTFTGNFFWYGLTFDSPTSPILHISVFIVTLSINSSTNHQFLWIFQQ